MYSRRTGEIRSAAEGLMLDWHPAAARHRIIVAAAASFMLSAGVSIVLQPAKQVA
jgi:hypothetical protein